MGFFRRRNRKKEPQPASTSDQPEEISEVEVRRLVDTSADLLDVGEAAQAKKLCLNIIEMSPNTAEAWSNLAYAELQLGDNSAAAAAAEKSLSIDPLSAIAWHNLAEAHQRETPEKALHCSSRSLTLDSNNAVSWGGRGTALMSLQRYEEAEACFGRALTINPHYQIAHVLQKVSHLYADERSQKLLMTTVGIALKYSELKLRQEDVLRLTRGLLASYKEDFDESLIRSFDCFAQMNIKGQKPLALHFCYINHLLAQLLGDSNLIELSSFRLKEAKAVFNV